MSHINNTQLYTFEDGKVVLASQLNQNTSVLQEAINDTDSKVNVASTSITNLQNNVTALLNDSISSPNIERMRLNGDNVLETSADGSTWNATASSGHIIVKPDGTTAPQRSRLKFTNTTVTDDGTQTIIAGLTGPTGATGPQGPTGATGAIGPQGPEGSAIIPSVDQTTGIMSFTKGPAGAVPSPVFVRGPQGPQGVAGPQGPQGIQGTQGPQGATGATGPAGAAGPSGPTGPQGPQGPTGAQGPTGPQGAKGDKGADGTSLTIKGLYASLAALQSAHPTGSAGDAYAVGTSTSNVIYIWSVDTSAWVNLGSIQGPEGPQGIQGVTGPQGIQGPQGAQGPTGATGPQGPTGATGATGATGPAGQGVATGGTTGQVLSKASGTNYDTAWITLSYASQAYVDSNLSSIAASLNAKADKSYVDTQNTGLQSNLSSSVSDLEILIYMGV